MKIRDKHYRTIWLADDGWAVEIIDQTRLPHDFTIARLETTHDAARAIKTMQVRGAPLIGVTAAYGLCLAIKEDPSDQAIDDAVELLAAQRPTAINLRWALNVMRDAVRNIPHEKRAETAYQRAAWLCDEDVETNRIIGEQGLTIIREIWQKNEGARVNILTHCNAGWLACVDWGTATSPIYQAYDEGIDVRCLSIAGQQRVNIIRSTFLIAISNIHKNFDRRQVPRCFLMYTACLCDQRQIRRECTTV